jgi:hypothetical protein
LEEASLLDDCEEERVPFKQQQRSGWRPPTLPPLSVRLPQLTGAALGSSSEVLSPRAGPHRYAAVAGASAVEEQEAFSPVRERMASGNKIAPMVDTRQSHCNEPDKNAAVAGGTVSNMVVTAKYTTASFLPKNLFEQFSRLANVYFLLISCLQIFTPLSPTSKYSTAAPLALVLMLNMVRELWEDSARHKADEEVNSLDIYIVC